MSLHSLIKKEDVEAVKNLLKERPESVNEVVNGTTPLILSCRFKCTDILKLLLRTGARVNDRDEEGNTALVISVGHGFLRSCKLLMEKGADMTITNAKGEDAFSISINIGSCTLATMFKSLAPRHRNLHAAAFLDDHAYVDNYLKNGGDADARTPFGMGAVYFACANGSLSMVTSLLDHGADPSCRNIHGVSCFMAAISNDNAEMLELLLEREVVATCANDGESVMMRAVTSGNEKIISFLIRKGFSVNDRDSEGYTPLILAAKDRNLSIVTFLVEAGANINAVNGHGETALYGACAFGPLEIVTYLVEKGADPAISKKHGFTCLHTAVDHNLFSIAEYLIGIGMDVNVINRRGRSPLHCVQSVEMTSLLLNHGAAINGHDSESTPLVDAITTKRKDVALHLISKGADVNHPPALFVAVEHGDVELTRALIAAGADLTAKTSEGCDTLMGAVYFGRLDILSYLLSIESPFVTVNGLTNFDIACQRGHLNFLRALWEVEYRPTYHSMQLAIRFGHADVVKYLMEKGFDFRLEVACEYGQIHLARLFVPPKKDDYNADAWKKVIIRDDMEFFKFLYDAIAPPVDILYMIAIHGTKKGTQMALYAMDKGIDEYGNGILDDNCLINAIRAGKEDLVRIFLEEGVTFYDASTPTPKIRAILEEAGAYCSDPVQKLWFACRNGNHEMVEKALQTANPEPGMEDHLVARREAKSLGHLLKIDPLVYQAGSKAHHILYERGRFLVVDGQFFPLQNLKETALYDHKKRCNAAFFLISKMMTLRQGKLSVWDLPDVLGDAFVDLSIPCRRRTTLQWVEKWMREEFY